jgi:hypothetical protein
MWVTYFPGAFYFYILALKSRALCFFSAVNPAIENGGMFFQSKTETYFLIPKEYLPTTLSFSPDTSLTAVEQAMKEHQMNFPIIAKPDRGERGWLVKILNNNQDVEQYITSIHRPFVLQSYIDYPIEVGIFYSRLPNEKTGTVSSITGKTLLKVTGDGQSTLKELIVKDDRAFLQLEIIEHQKLADLHVTLAKGETKTLVKIGNHSRGTTFLNWNHYITEELTQKIDEISHRIPGFYYGRFDILCQSMEDLIQGKQFYILELNGAGAEPAHIYEPGYSFFKAQQDIFWHIKRMHKIAKANHKNGVPYLSFFDFILQKRKELSFKKGLSNTQI